MLDTVTPWSAEATRKRYGGRSYCLFVKSKEIILCEKRLSGLDCVLFFCKRVASEVKSGACGVDSRRCYLRWMCAGIGSAVRVAVSIACPVKGRGCISVRFFFFLSRPIGVALFINGIFGVPIVDDSIESGSFST